GHGRDGEVGADPGGESLLGAEDQAADVRVQAVRADDQVEAARLAALEGHLAGLADGGDGVVEDVLHVVAAGLVEDLAQVVAHDLDVPVGERGDDLADAHPHGSCAAGGVDGQV